MNTLHMKKIPGTFTIVCYIVLAAALLTWVIPGGEYLREVQVYEGVERAKWRWRPRLIT